MMFRLLTIFTLCLVILAPQTSQVNSYVNGNILTADQLNSEFGNIYSTINGLDQDNLSSSTSIPPSKISATIDGSGISRDVNGVLSASVDGSTLEINADQIRIKDLGVTTAKIAAGAVTSTKLGSSLTLGLADGLAGTPSLSFTSDSDTGLYRVGNNSLALTAGGVPGLFIDGTAARNTNGFITHFPNGTVGDPAIAFQSDQDTGLYRSAANTMAITAGGLFAFSSDGTAARNTNGFITHFPDGTAVDPAIAFQQDQDTGFYRVGANTIGVSSGGTNVANINPTGMGIVGSLAVGAGNAAFKVSVQTGSIGGGGSTLTTAVAGTIVGYFGLSSNGTNTRAINIATSSFVHEGATSTDTQIALVNGSGASRTYRIVIFYQ